MRRNLLAIALLPLMLAEAQAWAQTPPQAVTPMTPNAAPSYSAFTPEQADYVKRVVMIPMRDGVKLYTVIVFKKGVKGGPILLSRTPYDAKSAAARNKSPLLPRSCRRWTPNSSPTAISASIKTSAGCTTPKASSS